MPTRSGKPYQDPNKKRNKVVTINTVNTPIGKEIADNRGIATMSCSRDLRGRKSNRKRVISETNTDIENATDNNWIVSDLSNNVNQKNDVNNCSMNSNIDDDFESKSETVTASSRKLRGRKSSITGDVKTMKIKKNKASRKDLTKTCMNSEEIDQADKNGFANTENVTPKDTENDYEKDMEQEHQKDTENDINSANIVKKQLKNKKKVKNSKKKKQRSKSSTHKTENLNDSGMQEDKHLNSSNNSATRDSQENLNLNFPQSLNKLTQKKHSNVLQIGIEKEDKKKIESEVNLKSPNIRKRKSSIKNSTVEQNNIFNTTYEKDERNYTNNKSIIPTNHMSDLDLNTSTTATGCLRRSEKGNNFEDNDNIGYSKSREINNDDNDASNISIISNHLDKNTSDRTSLPNKRRISSLCCVAIEIQNKAIDTLHTSLNKSAPNVDNNDLDSPNVSIKKLRGRKSNIINTTFDKQDANTTYVKDEDFNATSNLNNREIESEMNNKKKIFNEESDKHVAVSFDAFKKGAVSRKSSLKDVTFDKSNTSIASITKEKIDNERILSSSASKRKSIRRHTLDISNSICIKLDSTFDVTPNEDSKRKSRKLSEPFQEIVNTTFDKDIKSSSKSSLISSDNSNSYKCDDVQQVSITSDESEENILDTTPICIESSIDESKSTRDFKQSPSKVQTPLKREGTYTKDSPEVQRKSPVTPKRVDPSEMPPAGCTPFYVAKNSPKKSIMNVTRSMEKRMLIEAVPRLTRVMFCSPVDNPVAGVQERSKIIKSSLKGSNKSFVLENDTTLSRSTRKRSYTHSEAENTLAKRSRLAHDQQKSIDRVSRNRTASAAAKLTNTTPKKSTTPKSLSKTARSRLPNFAALHQREFAKMESLTDYKQRKESRARQMLTPSGAKDMLERISPKNDTETQISDIKDSTKDKTDTSTKKLPKLDSIKPYTRFGFKLNFDVNPFSIPPKTDTSKTIHNVIPPVPLPSLAGATLLKKEASLKKKESKKEVIKRENSFARREAARQAVMREKKALEKRSMNRKENRNIIRGVRTNRRFELQMKFRNIDKN